MEIPVILSDIVGLQDTVLLTQGVALGKSFRDKGSVDRAVNDHMGDMDTLRSQLPREALGEGAKAMLGTGKG